MRNRSCVFLAAMLSIALVASKGYAALGDCGQPATSGGNPTATDCLYILKAAVGAQACNPTCICDVNTTGGVTATDALRCLKKAVGENIVLDCGVGCSGTTTTTLATFTECGNGIIDGDEQCERLEGCAPGERCTAQCTCEPAPASPPSSQGLIEQALRDGAIDYPTSLLYRVWALFQAPELPEQFDGAGSEGEDTALFLELSHARRSLPPDIETAIAPYLVRPNDPASIYSQDPGTASALVTASANAPTPVGCPLDAIGQPDWRSFESAANHFVVWSCGGGIGGTDPHAARREVAAAVAEAIWTKFTSEGFAVPAPDDYVAGPAPQNRTDIYIVDPNQCRIRNNECVPITGDGIAAASPVSPCGRAGGGPLTSSAYLVVSANHVPTAAPGAAASKFRYHLTHEMFHAVTFGLNLEAQGGSCPNGQANLVPQELRSWLSEASAEWSSFAFYPDDDPERRTILFEKFQNERNVATEGLQNVAREILPYQAFLYPAFIQEESNRSPKPMLKFWRTSQAARNRDDLDTHLDQTLSFADHFRDFAVRNLNRNPPGIVPSHSVYDAALPIGTSAFIPEPSIGLVAPLDLSLPIAIAPLWAHYEHYYLNDEVRSARIDLSDVPNFEHVRLDAIVKVGSTWERRKVEGPLFEFCREDEGDDISEMYLVFSNDDRRRDGKIDGEYKLETRTLCPGGWSGYIRVVQTLDESSTTFTPFNSEAIERHEYQRQTWNVTRTDLITSPYPFPVERLVTAWHAQHSVNNVTTAVEDGCGTSIFAEVGNTSGTAQTLFDTFPATPGSFSLTPVAIGHEFHSPITYSAWKCDGTTSAVEGGQDIPEALAYIAMVQELTLLTPLPGDPGHFAGRKTVIHSELPAGDEGLEVIDITVSWDLRRTPQR